MKAKTMGCVAVVTILLAAPAIFAEDSINSDDWLTKHAYTRTTETTERDANGNVKSIRAMHDTTIYIRQTVSEIKKADAKGAIRTTNRTTTTTDTLGGCTVVTEGLVTGSAAMVTVGITTVDKTADGLVTTIYARDKTGNMVVTSKTTSVIVNNGEAPVVVLPQ